MQKETFNLTHLVNTDGCFDLQFRKDTRRERTGSPTYYRWKIQFVITLPKEEMLVLKKAIKMLGCGTVSVAKNQARLSVQNISELYQIVVPYFQKNTLADNKKKQFNLWQKAVAIIYQNKGIYLSKWKKNDLLSLMEIHKQTAKYKQKPRTSKWRDMAETLIKKEV